MRNREISKGKFLRAGIAHMKACHPVPVLLGLLLVPVSFFSDIILFCRWPSNCTALYRYQSRSKHWCKLILFTQHQPIFGNCSLCPSKVVPLVSVPHLSLSGHIALVSGRLIGGGCTERRPATIIRSRLLYAAEPQWYRTKYTGNKQMPRLCRVLFPVLFRWRKILNDLRSYIQTFSYCTSTC